MPKGIVRKLDELGRVTLPKEMRKSINLKDRDQVDIYFNDGVICIEKADTQKKCFICKSKEKLVEVDGMHICLNCAEKVQAKLKNRRDKQ